MKKIKKIYIFAIIFLTFLSGILFYFGTTFKIERKLIYNEKGNIDYKVYLKQNDYYDKEYLEKDKKYIASLIDHIDINYLYNFKSSCNMDYKCNYYILASSLVTDKSNENKVIFEKKKYLLNNQVKEINNTNDVNIGETISISYDDYNSIIKDFTNKYNLSNTNNKLYLSLCINLEGKSSDFENLVMDKSLLNMNIPLTDQTIDIGIDYKEIDNSGEKLDVSSNKLFNIIFFIIATIAAIFDILFIILIIRKYLILKKSESHYEREKNKILYQYNRAISHVNNLFDISLYKIMDIDNFVDLLNVRDCLDKPILFIELEKDKLSWFIVLDNNVLYRFVLGSKKNRNLK